MYGASQQTVFQNLPASVGDVVLRDGTQALTADWDAGDFQITAETFQSDVATGTAPLVIASTTLVTNLNAELLDGQEGTFYRDAGNLNAGLVTHERGGLEFDASAVTTGDLIRGSAAGTMSLLTIGTDGQVLTAQADGNVAWEDAIGDSLDGLTLKAPVKAATTANITLSNEQTIDGVSVVAGDRVLVKDQTTGTENGIYVVVSSGSWTRATDYAVSDAVAATFGHIEQGTANGDKKWLCTNNSGSDVVGTDALVYSLGVAGGGDVSGPASSTDNAIARWDGTSGDTLQNSAVTVDDNGRVIAAVDSGGYGFASGTARVLFDSSTVVLDLLAISSGASLSIGETGVSIQNGVLLMNVGASVGGTEVDWRTSNHQQITLSSSPTLTFVDPAYATGGELPSILFFKVIQDGTGSREITWPSSVKWAGGTAPTLTTDGSAVDLIQFVFDGSDYYGTVLGLDMQGSE